MGEDQKKSRGGRGGEDRISKTGGERDNKNGRREEGGKMEEGRKGVHFLLWIINTHERRRGDHP